MMMHLTMGVAGLLRIGLPPSWAQLYALIPGSEWVYPSAYVLTGIVAGIGIWRPGALRYSCLMSVALFFIWGALGLISMSRGTGGNIQGAFANFYIAGATLVLAYYVSVGTIGNRLNQKITKLQDEVTQGEKINGERLAAGIPTSHD